MVETIELEFDIEEARLVLLAGTGRVKLRGDNWRVVILNWKGTTHLDYPIEGFIPDIGSDVIFHWTKKGELTKDQISMYDLIIEGEL
jgi:hypothetical protein